jgi:hypothetical protein
LRCLKVINKKGQWTSMQLRTTLLQPGYVSFALLAAISTTALASASTEFQELPTHKVPNIPQAGEAYYAPDSYHFIAQTKDPDAQKPEGRAVGGSLTYIFTDDLPTMGTSAGASTIAVRMPVRISFRISNKSSGHRLATTWTCRWVTGRMTWTIRKARNCTFLTWKATTCAA